MNKGIELINLPHSEACERNKAPILEVLKKHLAQGETRVLEVGSGTGQHAEYFAQQLPKVHWQTADQHDYLMHLRERVKRAERANLQAPFELDVNGDDWLNKAASDTVLYDAVFTANTFHIMDSGAVENFFKGLSHRIKQHSVLFVYGPFRYAGEFTSESNAGFDLSLRSRGVGSAIREIEWIVGLAVDVGLTLIEDIAMPANNQCLVFKCE